MTDDDLNDVPEPLVKAPGPAARRRAERAAAKAAPASVSGRLLARFKRRDVRRRTAAILLLTASAAVGWSVLGSNESQDVAQGLTNVLDAKVLDDAMPGAAMPTLLTAAAPNLPQAEDLPEDEPQSADASAPATSTVADGLPALTDLRETQAVLGEGDCAITVDAMSLAAATIAMDISAPCDAGSRVDVVQSDLQFAIVLDEAGTATLQMPALSDEPAVAILVADRDPLSFQTEAVDVRGYHRAILYWQGSAGLELHAFEGEASYGDDGHVGPEAPRTIAHALSGNGGFLTPLGDPGIEDARLALVYTLPAGLDATLSIEAPVTEANCAQDIYGGTIQVGPGIPVVTQDITMTMPTCEAVGDYVMLGNLMQPIAVASTE
ncbi:hypothetical protein JANAI62_30250 [Jannaschia pagri]|uniref:Translocase n=1 Tax=Jannaschia pagri TaxID=2829797 RepID=A0ABQ4NQP2_9RHOB|nr:MULTISPECIES: hypothetical protein [unclassified Jannaschia]GIT92738.1 hypothetical protein JANAI61_31960 [Jannaschia sp. AI_61]GIT96402.1 hypothetical protein JANAI62_30250 [Jannaschia sp. AI_62]